MCGADRCRRFGLFRGRPILFVGSIYCSFFGYISLLLLAYLSFGEDEVAASEDMHSDGHELCKIRLQSFCFAYEYDFLVQLGDANRGDLVAKFPVPQDTLTICSV